MSRVRLHNDDWGYESNCFVCEPTNDRGLQIPFFHDRERGVVVADFELSDSFSGAPTLVHGGVTLAVLDEAMAWACIAIGRRWAVTTHTATTFHRAIHVDRPYRVAAEIVEQHDAELVAEARVHDTKGTVRAEARATFTPVGEAQMKRALGLDDDAELDDAVRLAPLERPADPA